jgi:apolipoprotein N-acyltransferase
MFLATLAMQHRWKLRLPILTAFVVGLTGPWMINRKIDIPRDHAAPKIVGIQLETLDYDTIYLALESAIDLHPDTDIFVLCEGAFFPQTRAFVTEPPRWVNDWCKKNQVHLIAGAVDEINRSLGLFYNSAFVWGPSGQIIFKQAKAQPVQFLEWWQPAESQECWQSPWGPIGIAICYDISFRRVMDVLVEQGAELLIIPAVDPISWGAYEHVLDARNTPIRAAEYGVPVIRVCSSGISQAVSPNGYEIATAPFPGQGELLVAQLPMQAGSRPIDVLLALPAGLLFGIVIAFGMFAWLGSYIKS